MTKIKRILPNILLPLLFLPELASAHPGHEDEGFLSSAHLLFATEPYLISLGLLLFVVSAIWLLKRI